MEVHDIVQRVPSERVRHWLSATFRVTPDPVPDWLGPGQAAAAVTLFAGFAGLLLIGSQAVWSALITLGALASLVLRLLCLRWAPALRAGPWPRAGGTGNLAVTVVSGGPTPVKAGKVVQEITGVSPRAARDAVTTAPTTLLTGMDRGEATRVADALRASGAEVAVEPHASPVEAAEA